MTLLNARHIAIILCLTALITCVRAHPDGSQSFDGMDFDAIWSIGSQFSDAFINNNLAQMTTTPMMGTQRRSSPPQQHHLQSHFHLQPSQPSQPRFMHNGNDRFLSNWRPDEAASMNSQYTTAQHTAAQNYAGASDTQHHQTMAYQNQQPGGMQSISSTFSQAHHTQPIPVGTRHHFEPNFRPQPYDGSIPTSAPIDMIHTHGEGQCNVQPEWNSMGQYMQLPGPSLDHSDLQAFSVGPVRAPQPLSAPFAMSNSQFEPLMSRSAPNIPEILPMDMTNDFNYHSGSQKNSVENMRGWIGRAPTFGDRAVLRIDTNYLAPPESRSANHTPSTASTSPSSARAGSMRRRLWQMTSGDFVCGYCKAGFPTQSDLTHHLRSHAPYMSRQHVCKVCEKRFQYRKDLMRHLPKHDPNRQKYYCRYPGCKYHTKGFGRQDHLDRHMGSQHPQHRADTPQQNARTMNHS